MARLPTRCLLLLLLVALYGCGFRLAGSTPLPQEISRIYLVTSDIDRRQQAELLGRLRSTGADVSLEPAADRVTLSVRLKTLADRRVVTSASSGQTVDRVARELTYSLKDSDGKLLTESRTLSQQSDFRFDDDNLLSSTQEKDRVVEDLEQALFDQLIRQLQSI
jgi:LPS-assembly lipoprotein